MDRAVTTKRMRKNKFSRQRSGRRLLTEVLEVRLALSSQSVFQGPLESGLLRPFPDGLGHENSEVRAAIGSITTTAPSSVSAFLDLPQLGPAGGAADDIPGDSLVESTALIGLPQFRNDERFVGIDGDGYSVVILDSGIDLDHPFFGPDTDEDGVADRIVYNADFITGRPNADDVYGHGTHVSSIIASQDSTYAGLAPGVNIIHLRVLNDFGSGTAAAIEEALQWVVANVDEYNIASVNMSLSFADNHGSPTTRPELGLSDELAAIVAQDVIVVSAAGNHFFHFGSAPGVAYPSADPNSLAVGATWDTDVTGPVEWNSGAIDHTTGPDRITAFSQRHPTMTDVVAPGAAIAAAAIGGGTTILSGTSMAAPHVAGVAAIMQQLAVQELGRRLTFAEFASLARATGIPVVDGDDEDDNVENTHALFHRIDIMSLANGILSDGLSDLSIPGGVEVNSPSVAAGGIARLDFTVANQGLTATGAFEVGVYLSSDSIIDSSDLLLKTIAAELSGGDGTAYSKYGVALPADIVAGDYYLGVLLDVGSSVVEVSEQNNATAAPITVTGDMAEMWVIDAVTGQQIFDGVTTISFGQIEQGVGNATRTFRIYNDGTVDLVLSTLSLPAGFAVNGLPASVSPLSTAEFTISLLGNSNDGGYTGTFSIATNDIDENPFDVLLTGQVDHGNTANAATVTSAGSSADGTIAPAADVDWFRFDALAGVAYEFEVVLGSLPDSVLRLVGSNGATQLAINDNQGANLGSLITWTAPADGTYFLEVRGKGAVGGTYTLTLSAGDEHGNDAATSTFTTDPSTNKGALESPGDVDWFSFEASARVSYRFETAISTLGDSILRLYSVDGTTELAVGDSFGPGGPSLIDWTAPDDGIYYLAVSAASPLMIGAYELLISGEDDHGDNAANASPSAVDGGSIEGEIEEPFDVDWFQFSTVAGAEYDITASLGNLNRAVMRLIDVDGATELELAANPRPNVSPTINWTAPTSGVYFVEISGLDARTGDYELSFAVVDDHGNNHDDATPATDPSSAVGVIETPGDADWFTFDAFAGVAYRIEVSAGELSGAIVRLVGSDGATELGVDSGVSGAPAVIEWTAVADGAYYIHIAAAQAEKVGAYELNLLGDDDHGDNLENATPATVPNSLDGVIERLGDVDWFSLPTLAGLDYQVDVTLGTLAGAALRILRADGATVVASAVTGGDGLATVQWTATTGGTYYIEILANPSGGAVPANSGGGEAEAPGAGGTYTLTPSLLSAIPGDYDGNLVVDGKDFLVWQRNYGAKKIPLNSAGFESYEPGPLQGQHGWVQLGGSAGSAIVQEAVAADSDWAVRVDRASNVDNRWAVPLGSNLPTGDVILVSWDMRVTATGNEEQALGPFFGVEAYDDKGIFGLLGSLGVDATTLDVLYQHENGGILVEANRKVDSDAWNNFGLLFNFTLDQYTIYLNGEPLATTRFVDRGPGGNDLDQFTDADISAIAAQSNLPSKLVTGTAYFDNFVVFNGLPEQRLAGDGNNDGVVDSLDVDLWKRNYGLSAAIGSGTGGIPATESSRQSTSSESESLASNSPTPITTSTKQSSSLDVRYSTEMRSDSSTLAIKSLPSNDGGERPDRPKFRPRKGRDVSTDGNPIAGILPSSLWSLGPAVDKSLTTAVESVDDGFRTSSDSSDAQDPYAEIDAALADLFS